MRRVLLAASMLTLGSSVALAQESCHDTTTLMQLDAEWEKAQLEANVKWLQVHLADEFIWVHNHAKLVDSKDKVLARARAARSENAALTRSRVQSDVEAQVVGSTGVVTGFTIVDRGGSAKRYHCMRTYVTDSGRRYFWATTRCLYTSLQALGAKPPNTI